MTKDVALFWDIEANNLDISFFNGDLKNDLTFLSSIQTQLFTRQRLFTYEQPNKFLQQGWVGSVFFEEEVIGSKLEYILTQSDLSLNSINKVKEEINNSLQFLVELNLIQSFNIDITTNPITNIVFLDIKITNLDTTQENITQEVRL